MNMLNSASQTPLESDDEDIVEYVNSLREACLEAYTCIVQGMKEAEKHELLLPFIEAVARFMVLVSEDEYREDSVTRGACGLLGDIASSIGPKVGQYLKQQYAMTLVKAAAESESEQTNEIGRWCQKTLEGLP